MTTQEAIKPVTNHRFYGWIAVTGGAFSALIGGGIFFYAYGVFLPMMVSEFGWSRAVVGLGMSLGAISFGLPSPLSGVLVGRFGARANLIVGNLLGALGMAGMFLAHEVWQVYLFYCIAGFGCSLGGLIPASTIANSWFIKKRSLAIGIIMACGGVGGFFFPLVATAISGALGWRMAWVVLGGILFVGASFIGGFIMARNKPEDMGQRPDGVSAVPEKAGIAHPLSEKGEEPRRWTMKRVLTNRTIWLILGFGGAAGFVQGVMTGHLVAYLRDLGANPMVAATALSVVAGCSVAGSLGLGALAIKINIRRLVIIYFVVRLAALSILLTTQNIALIYIFSVLFGMSNGAIGTAKFTIGGSYYGRENFSRIQGVIALGLVLQAAGPVVAGAIYDKAGSYWPAFILITIVTFVGLFCAFLARPPK